ncbi:MAG: alanyl-tRNA editing protein [Candidatus Promineifilaceae bacterium]
MTIRTYYSDAYTMCFPAMVVSSLEDAEHPGVLLEKSYFYPTSGGQRHDLGKIGGRNVIDVIVRESDNAVVHLLDAPLAVGEHSAEIDWPRRFDHMQQHSGQHILSQAFIQVADAATVSFHMGDHACTIDLDVKQLSAEMLSAAEALANKIVWENRPIKTYFIDKADIPNYALRKVPDVAGDKLRIVDIQDFDVNACGGTHVRHTGEVGIIKLTKLERIRKQVRVEFRCGQRALRDYETKNEILSTLAKNLTCAQADLPKIVGNLSRELKRTGKALKKANSQILQAEAATLLASAEVVNGVRIVQQVFEHRDSAEIRQLANQIGRNDQTIALLGLAGKNSQIMLVRAKNAPGSMKLLLQSALDKIGGSGGGSDQFAQGGGPTLKRAAIESLLDSIKIELG